MTPRPITTRITLALGCALLLAAPGARAVSSDDVTAVSSRVSPDYTRVRLSDGRLAEEPYAFGQGGRWAGTASDPSIDRLRFVEVARMISGPLRDRGFVPARDPKSTRLLIMVYWGRTMTPMRDDASPETENLQDASAAAADTKTRNSQQASASGGMEHFTSAGMVCGHVDPSTTASQVDDQIDADSAMTGALAMVAAQDRIRDAIDARNASILGFDTLWNDSADYRGTPLEIRRQDLVGELEQSRYFVVLMAYDFQALVKHKQHRLLWETRFSIRQRHHDFGQVLTVMARNASAYFGSESHGVERVAVPEGRVDVGPVRSLGSLESP